MGCHLGGDGDPQELARREGASSGPDAIIIIIIIIVIIDVIIVIIVVSFYIIIINLIIILNTINIIRDPADVVVRIPSCGPIQRDMARHDMV